MPTDLQTIYEENIKLYMYLVCIILFLIFLVLSIILNLFPLIIIFSILLIALIIFSVNKFQDYKKTSSEIIERIKLNRKNLMARSRATLIKLLSRFDDPPQILLSILEKLRTIKYEQYEDTNLQEIISNLKSLCDIFGPMPGGSLFVDVGTDAETKVVALLGIKWVGYNPSGDYCDQCESIENNIISIYNIVGLEYDDSLISSLTKEYDETTSQEADYYYCKKTLHHMGGDIQRIGPILRNMWDNTKKVLFISDHFPNEIPEGISLDRLLIQGECEQLVVFPEIRELLGDFPHSRLTTCDEWIRDFDEVNGDGLPYEISCSITITRPS